MAEEEKKYKRPIFPEKAYQFAGLIKKRYAKILGDAMSDRELVKETGNPVAAVGSVLMVLLTNILLDMKTILPTKKGYEGVKDWVIDTLENIDTLPQADLKEITKPLIKQKEQDLRRYG